MWLLPPFPPFLWVTVLAQQSADNIWINATERLGIGVVVAAVFGLALRRVYNEKAELEAVMRTEVVPALVKATVTMEKMAGLLERQERRMDQQ